MTTEQLFEENKGMVYFCYSKLIKDEFIVKSREDILQEGFLALWKACILYDDTLEIKISNYIFPAIQNAMLRWVRLNRCYYYNCLGFDDPVQDCDNLTLGDTLSDIEELEDIAKTVADILKRYKKWLVETHTNCSDRYFDLHVYRANIILNELINKEKVTTRYIEEEYNINRTVVSRTFNELREALKDEFPTRFKNRRTKNGNSDQ